MYAKVFGSIFDGSMRGHSDLILVFVNLLCAADPDGIIDRHWQAIVDETGLPADRVRAALIELESPDEGSRSRNDEGRRLKRIDPERDWGWQIINFKHYRALRNQDERREYMRNLMRDKRKQQKLTPVSNSLAMLANTDTDTDTEAKKNTSPVATTPFDRFWKAYPRKQGKKKAFSSWNRLQSKPEMEFILNRLTEQIQTNQWKKENGQFIPMPETWINQERWNDEILPAQSTPSPRRPSRRDQFDDALHDCVDQFKRLFQSKGTPEDVGRLILKLKDQYRDILHFTDHTGEHHLIIDAQDIAKFQLKGQP